MLMVILTMLLITRCSDAAAADLLWYVGRFSLECQDTDMKYTKMLIAAYIAEALSLLMLMMPMLVLLTVVCWQMHYRMPAC